MYTLICHSIVQTSFVSHAHLYNLKAIPACVSCMSACVLCKFTIILIIFSAEVFNDSEFMTCWSRLFRSLITLTNTQFLWLSILKNSLYDLKL